MADNSPTTLLPIRIGRWRFIITVVSTVMILGITGLLYTVFQMSIQASNVGREQTTTSATTEQLRVGLLVDTVLTGRSSVVQQTAATPEAIATAEAGVPGQAAWLTHLDASENLSSVVSNPDGQVIVSDDRATPVRSSTGTYGSAFATVQSTWKPTTVLTAAPGGGSIIVASPIMGQSGFLGVLISRIDMTLFRNVLSNGSSAAVVDPVGTLVQLAASGPISLDATTLHSATTDIPGSLQNANEVIVWGRFHGDLDIVLAQSTTGGVYTTTVRNAAVIAITLAVMALVGARFLDRSLNAQRVAVKALHSAAVHDPLTGIPNRALFGDRLQYAVATTKRTGRPFSLVYIDLDDFKRVNDTLGHKAGDAYLCAIADRLVGVLRATDIVARLGGDEFALILPDTDQTGSVTAIEKCARAMDGDFRLEDRTVRCLGLSFGVATYSGGQDDAAALMKTADAAMYQDKQSHKQRR